MYSLRKCILVEYKHAVSKQIILVLKIKRKNVHFQVKIKRGEFVKLKISEN